ncbi:CatB-related O-acetyltransferase [Cupriavidus alkaliphilus]|uniref:CatB-related O-acetyltransferase n=1 Tax=Cupriavidus alkaliphilus TaxID=942866 RepID=UPI003133BEA6
MPSKDERTERSEAAREMRNRCAALGGRIAATAQVNPALVFGGPIDIADGVVIYAPSEIGNYSYLNVGTVVFPHVKIGRFCSIGRNVQIGLAKHPTKFLSSHPFQFSKSLFAKVPGYETLQKEKWQFHAPTEIGHDVWIGAGAMVSSGICIGHGAVIGAGAVVTKDVEPYTIVGGVPAKKIGTRFEDEISVQLLRTRWWDLPFEVLVKIDFGNIEVAVGQLSKLREASESDNN